MAVTEDHLTATSSHGRAGQSSRHRRRRHAQPAFDNDVLAEARRTLPDEAGSRTSLSQAPPFEVWARLVRYSRESDPRDLEVLVEEYRGLAIALASRLYRHGEPLEELRQVALEALVCALKSFDPAHRIPFPGYAAPVITGRLKRHYRDHGWAIRTARRHQELHIEARVASEHLRASLGREPTETEVAQRIGASSEELRAAEAAMQARSTVPIDGPDADAPARIDLLGIDDSGFVGAERRIDLRRAVAELDEQSCELIELYYWRQLSQAEIAARYGVSQMQVSRWLARIVTQLRSAMTA